MKPIEGLPYHHISRSDNSVGAMRYVLALAIVVIHFQVLTGVVFENILFRYGVVCAFFAISGFFAFTSYHHAGTGRRFLLLRAGRLLPSYVTVVAGCALCLCAVSTLSVADYFADAQTWRYLLANLLFLNFLCPDLPGVFEGGEMTAVNGALWTMKVEVMLTLSLLPVVWLLTRKNVRIGVLAAVVISVALVYRGFMLDLYYATDKPIYEMLSRQILTQLAVYFIGILFYTYYIRLKRHMLAISLAGLVIYIVCKVSVPSLLTEMVVPIAFVIMVLAGGLSGSVGRWQAKLPDCSYEIYLFHFPVIQVIAHSRAPQDWGLPICFVVAVVVTYALSWLCARYISTPIGHYTKKLVISDK